MGLVLWLPKSTPYKAKTVKPQEEINKMQVKLSVFNLSTTKLMRYWSRTSKSNILFILEELTS